MFCVCVCVSAPLRVCILHPLYSPFCSSNQVCQYNQYQPPHKMNPSSQIVYNLTGIKVENYLLATANNYIRNRLTVSMQPAYTNVSVSRYALCCISLSLYHNKS